MMDLLTLGLMVSQFLFKQFPNMDIKDPMQLMYMLKASPDKALELYKHLMILEKEMQKLMIEDRRHARNLQTPAYRRFAMLAVVGIGLIFCLMVMQQPCLSKEMLAVVSTLSGILGACMKDIYAFEFGGGNDYMRQRFRI